MADSSNSDMEHECVLSITPTIETTNKNSNSKTITEEVYKIIKENYGLFPVYFPKVLREECEVQCTEFNINYEQDVHMIFTCRFASDIEQRKFLMCVNNGRLTKIFTKFSESISIARDMGLDLTANLILYANSLERQKSNHNEIESSRPLSNPTAKEDRKDVLSDHMTHCKEVSTEMQTSNQVVKNIGKTDQTHEHPEQQKTIRVYVHTDPKSVISVRLCHKTNILHMKNLHRTHFWETYILQSNIEERFNFTIEVDYYVGGYFGVLRSKLKNKSSLLSEYDSLSYVFIVMPIGGYGGHYSDALFEMMRFIVSSVSSTGTKEGLKQLDSLMSETALSPFVALRLKRRDFRLDDAKFILKDMIVEDNNVFVYCYLIYHLIADLTVLSRDKVVVDVKKAQTILKSCSRIAKIDITSKSAKKVARVLQHLCKLVYKDEASLLLLIDKSYDLFGNEVFIELVDNSLDDKKRVLYLYKPSKHLDCTGLLDRLYNFALGDKSTIPLVEQIFRHFPLMPHIDFVEEMKQYDLYGPVYSVIEESLSFKGIKEMIALGSKGELEAVLEIWQRVCNLCVDNSKKLSEAAEKGILTALDIEEKMISFKSVSLLFNALKVDVLFENSTRQLKLLKLLSESKNHDLQQLFLDLLKYRKYSNLEEDKMCQIISTWFANTLQDFKTRSGINEKDKIFKYYFNYDRITCTDYVNQHESTHRKLEDIILNVMQKCKFKAMILAIPEMEASADLSDTYTKHINRILRDGYIGRDANDIIQDICGFGSSRLLINSRTTLSIIKTTLDTMEVAVDESMETIIGKVMNSSKFWIFILTAEGTLVNEMKQHCKVKAVEAAVKNTISAINKQTINSKLFLLLLNKELESKSLLYCMTENIHQLERKIERYEKKINDYKFNLDMIDDTFRKLKWIPVRKLQLLLKKCIDYTKTQRDNLMMGNLTVQELSNTTPEIQLVQDIAERCKHIETAVSTCVFGNLIRQYFENNEKELEEIENESEDCFLDDELSLTFLFDEHFLKSHDGKHVNLQSVLRIVEIIVKDCFGLYKQLWDNYANETEHSITDLRTMFLGVKDMDKEIRQAEKTCLFRLQPHTRNSLIRFSNLPSYGQTVDTIKVAAKTFKFDNKQDSLFLDTVLKFEGLLSGNLSGITLQDMTPVLNQIDIVHNVINSDLQDILQALKHSSALLDFLREVADDDLRNLIDAVEEHSEQYVRESTVSDLIEIKRFFNPVLKGNFLENIGKLFELLQRQVENIGNNKIPEKIFICRDNLHSLKALYRNVANRGERTVEVIENIMQKGVFRFLLTSRACEVTTEYKQVKKKYKQSGADLSDLRSRALLLMNAEERDKSKPKSVRKDDLEKFVHIVDEAFEVAAICMQLKRAGHFEFSKYEENCRRENLNEIKCQLQNQYEEWISEIHACRRKYYYLNFLYADQLYELYSFLHKAKKNDVIVMAILRFIDPSIEDLRKITLIYDSLKNVSSGDHIAALENIGQTLEELYSRVTTTPTKFLECLEHTNLTEKVQPGVPYVTSLADGSPLVIRTLLALYLNTTGMFPQANQVLFCRKDTTYDEITLLLNRCIQKQSSRTPVKSLYSIANIELLPSEVQFCLHNEIRRLSICSNGYDFLLCLLCRGHENHPFLDQFSDILSRPSPLSDLKLKQYLVEQWSHVKVVTSDVPGLGKSEFIQRKAIADKKRPVCIHISGPFNRLSIIEEMIKIRLKNYHVLHLDIGVISDPDELDLFMFEMIVLRYVSAGSTAYALACTSISIEIANTINDELRDALPTVTCFSRENLQWNCYSDLRVSSEINSPVQVVCHYLKCLDDGLIDTQDLYFTGPNALKPMTSTKCARILRSHFEVSGDMSFTLMNIFINEFQSEGNDEKGQRPSVKSNLVKALENVSMDFAARSVNACRSAQTASVSNKATAIADILANRVSGMIRWEDSNHLVVLFHQNVQTVSALYRNVKDVPLSVRNLFDSQVKSKLTDFMEKSTEELKHLLLKLTRNSIAPIDMKHLALSMTKYALTPDNLLKMVLISLRVNSNVPVLIMGETGCGKTSLIRFLAKVCDVKFEVFTIHAGIEESDIILKFSQTNLTAFQHLNDQFWLFLDEINTCNHLGLITDSLCHRMLLGTEIAPNLTILAACNPYRLRQEEEILTTGLQGKIGKDELSRLVYRVNPLPEALIDYVWDYGSLSEEDEKSYIAKMVDSTFLDKKANNAFNQNACNVTTFCTKCGNK
ncbi:RNF213 [Mytilus coruscus]|uniref:RNF213 n=1 Tax=Mytilus coruscus TaxID=42192 RepID=A0A6J8CS85_MYTCO|nr:RNF213 [Mytilus coruscus]